jgi:hypothetical protein
MDIRINPSRVRKALEALKDAERELEAALREAEQPRPDPPPGPVKFSRRPKSMRRI